MIESTVRDYLLTALSVPIYIDVPSDPPGSYVVIERTGGGMEEHIRNAMVAIQSYGESKAQAAALHEAILAAMPDLIEQDDISACNLNSEYDFTDTSTKRYRYQCVFDIIYY